MIYIRSPTMRSNGISSDDLGSSFGNLSLTDDLADFMKLSILMKCHNIQKDVHNITIGPQSTMRATQSTEKKEKMCKSKPFILSSLTNTALKDTRLSAGSTGSPPPPRSIRNEANIVHLKTLAELESQRMEDLNVSIEKRRQKFIDFEQKQLVEKKISWQTKQEAMIQSMQNQEIKIKKILEEHEKEMQAKNKNKENQYRQLAEKRIQEERDLKERKKQIKGIVEGLSKCHSEFTVIFNYVAEDIRKINASQRTGFATYVSTLDQLRQQLEAILTKCKSSAPTLTEKDLSKCSEIIDLANRIRKQVHDGVSKLEQKDVKEEALPFSLQTHLKQLSNVPQLAPVATPPSKLFQTANSTLFPAPQCININQPLFGQSIPPPQSIFNPPSQAISVPIPKESNSIFQQSSIFHTPNQSIFGATPKEANSTPQGLPMFHPSPQSIVELTPKESKPKSKPDSKPLSKLDRYVNKALLEKYVHLQNLLKEKEEVSKQILEDPALKSFKNNCRKVINTPVNTLTDATSHHVLDKYNKLNNVLSGRTVEISGDHINVGQHPHGIDFCMDLLAKKFVLQGDLIISSNTAVSAFNYASVILSLWNDFPVFGDLLMGHFYRECPYLLPFYPPQVPGQTDEEFAASQGYRFPNGELEGQDTFLKRMVGYMRLHAATLVSSPKQSHNGVSRQSMAVAWQWLASIMNLQPRVDITAAMIHTFLEIVGYKMQQVFDTEGPVHRLELLLQDYAKHGSFPEPEGMLPTNFW